MAMRLPGTTALKHLPVTWRVLGLATIFTIPLALLAYFLVVEKSDLIEFARTEIQGAHYLRPIHAALVDVAVDPVNLDGAQGDGALLAQANGSIGKALSVDGTAAADALAKLNKGSDGAAAIGALTDLIGPVADKSNLSLDPDLDAYYLQDALTVELPGVLAHASEARAIVKDVVASGSSEERRVGLAVALAALQSSSDGFATSMDKAMGGNGDGSLKTKLGDVTKTVSDATKRSMDAMKAVDAAGASKATGGLTAAARAYFPAGDDQLEGLLTARIAGFQNQLYQRLGVVLAIVLLGVYFVYLTARSIIVPIVGMTDAMNRLAGRELEARLRGTDRRDELGAMARALAVFQEQLIQARDMAAAQKKEQSAKEERARKVNALTADFDSSIGHVVQAVTDQANQMESSAQSLSATAEQSTKQASAVAAASEEASANVQTVASAPRSFLLRSPRSAAKWPSRAAWRPVR